MRHNRQLHCEYAAFSFACARSSDASAVLLHKPFRQRQTNSKAHEELISAFVELTEHFEDSAGVFRRDTESVILHGNFQLVNPDGGRNHNMAALARVLGSVG
jgi:hypothetical protein